MADDIITTYLILFSKKGRKALTHEKGNNCRRNMQFQKHLMKIKIQLKQ